MNDPSYDSAYHKRNYKSSLYFNSSKCHQHSQLLHESLFYPSTCPLDSINNINTIDKVTRNDYTSSNLYPIVSSNELLPCHSFNSTTCTTTTTTTSSTFSSSLQSNNLFPISTCQFNSSFNIDKLSTLLPGDSTKQYKKNQKEETKNTKTISSSLPLSSCSSSSSLPIASSSSCAFSPHHHSLLPTTVGDTCNQLSLPHSMRYQQYSHNPQVNCHIDSIHLQEIISPSYTYDCSSNYNNHMLPSKHYIPSSNETTACNSFIHTHASLTQSPEKHFSSNHQHEQTSNILFNHENNSIKMVNKYTDDAQNIQPINSMGYNLNNNFNHMQYLPTSLAPSYLHSQHGDRKYINSNALMNYPSHHHPSSSTRTRTVNLENDEFNRNTRLIHSTGRTFDSTNTVDTDYLNFLSRERKYHHQYPQYESNTLQIEGRKDKLNAHQDKIGECNSHSSTWWGDGSAWRPANNYTVDGESIEQPVTNLEWRNNLNDNYISWLPGTIDSMYPQTNLPCFNFDPIVYNSSSNDINCFHASTSTPYYLSNIIDDVEDNQPTKRQQLDKLFDGNQVHSCVDGCFFLLRFSLFILLLTKLILISTLLIQGRLITHIDYTRIDDTDVTLIITGYLILTVIFALIIPVPESKFHTHYITIILLNCFTIGELFANTTSINIASTSVTSNQIHITSDMKIFNSANLSFISSTTISPQPPFMSSRAAFTSSSLADASSSSSPSFLFTATSSSSSHFTASTASSKFGRPSFNSTQSSGSYKNNKSSPSKIKVSSNKSTPPPLHQFVSTTPSTFVNSRTTEKSRIFDSVSSTTTTSPTNTTSSVLPHVKSNGPLIITADLNLPSLSVSVIAFIYLICLTLKVIFSIANYFVFWCKPPSTSHILVLKVPPSNL